MNRPEVVEHRKLVVWFSRLVLGAFSAFVLAATVQASKHGRAEDDGLLVGIATLILLVWSFYAPRVALFGAAAVFGFFSLIFFVLPVIETLVP